MAINIAHGIFKKLSPMSSLSPHLMIVNRFDKTEEARSVMSYAVGGVIENLSTKKLIMLQNAHDAQENANLEMEHQFTNIVKKSLRTVLKRKYEQLLYKKELLKTGNKVIVYNHPNFEIGAYIARLLTKLRHDIRTSEQHEQKETSKLVQEYKRKKMIFTVFETLRRLIENGTNNLSVYKGKTLTQIVEMLHLPAIALTPRQEQAFYLAENPINQVAFRDLFERLKKELTASPSSYEDHLDMEFITTLPYKDDEVSIIPYWLQIRYAEEYNDMTSAGEVNKYRLCEAFADYVLTLKGVEKDTDEFNRQKRDFCDRAGKDLRDKIYNHWINKTGLFESPAAVVAVRSMLKINLPLKPELPIDAKPEEIASWFARKIYKKAPAQIQITKDDIFNNTEGLLKIDDTDNNYHSCQYVFVQGKSVWDIVGKVVADKVMRPIRRYYVQMMLNDGLRVQEAELRAKEKISSVTDIQGAYDEYMKHNNMMIRKRVEKALHVIYNPDNKTYEFLQRLLSTTFPDNILYEKMPEIEMTMMHLREKLANRVLPLSLQEMEQLERLENKDLSKISLDDKMWLQRQLSDLVAALNFFHNYLKKKGFSGNLNLKQVTFVVNLFGKCMDKIDIDIDTTDDIPVEFKKLVFVQLENNSLRYLWAYLMMLYKARVLLRQKLAEKNVQLENQENINRISLKIAQDFINNDPRTNDTVFLEKVFDQNHNLVAENKDARLLNAIALAFATIIGRLRQFLRNSRLNYTLGEDEFVFAYQMLSSYDGNVPATDDKTTETEVRNFIERLDGSIGNPSALAVTVNNLFHHLVNNPTRYDTHRDRQLYYFIQNDDVKEIVDIKEDDKEDDDKEDDEDKSNDDDQPDDNQDYGDEEEENREDEEDREDRDE